MGPQGPFHHGIPRLDHGPSLPCNPPSYAQEICNIGSSTQVINVNNANGIALCKVAATGFAAATNATFQGIILGGGTVTQTQALPQYKIYVDVTFDLISQPLSAINIITTGCTDYTAELWEISYVLL